MPTPAFTSLPLRMHSSHSSGWAMTRARAIATQRTAVVTRAMMTRAIDGGMFVLPSPLRVKYFSLAQGGDGARGGVEPIRVVDEPHPRSKLRGQRGERG